MRVEHEVQTTRSDAVAHIDDDLDVEWHIIEYGGIDERKDSIEARTPPLKREVRGKATRRRKEHHEDEQQQNRDVVRTDSVEMENQIMSKESETRRKHYPGTLILIVIIAGIVIYRKVFKQ